MPRLRSSLTELDYRPQLLCQHRLILSNLADHRLGRLALEEELDRDIHRAPTG
jgi:hypothetical protein